MEGGGGGGAVMNSNYHAFTDHETPALCEGSDSTLGCFSFNKHQSRPALLELKRDLVLHASPQLALKIPNEQAMVGFMAHSLLFFCVQTADYYISVDICC